MWHHPSLEHELLTQHYESLLARAEGETSMTPHRHAASPLKVNPVTTLADSRRNGSMIIGRLGSRLCDLRACEEHTAPTHAREPTNPTTGIKSPQRLPSERRTAKQCGLSAPLLVHGPGSPGSPQTGRCRRAQNDSTERRPLGPGAARSRTKTSLLSRGGCGRCRGARECARSVWPAGGRRVGFWVRVVTSPKSRCAGASRSRRRQRRS